jgi:Bifunctional DNA primase/polymerase, N-terminal
MPTNNGPGRAGDAVEAGGDRAWTDAKPNTTPACDPQAAVDAALGYARCGWPLFPCQWQGERRKRPLVAHGLHAASRDEAQIRNWWRRWPHALIGIPTGRATGFVLLDIDLKDAVNGFDSLAELGFAILPVAPMTHTATGGLHLYFLAPEYPEIGNTTGAKGRGMAPGSIGGALAATSSCHLRAAATPGILIGT